MSTDRPKGILIPIGGHEDKAGDKAVLCRVLEETRKKKPIIEVITIATNLPEEVGRDYHDAFGALDVGDVGEIFIRERKEVKDFIERIEKCDAVFFSGGNQLKLTTLLGGTDLIEVLKKRYEQDENFVIAGTSAGAAAMSDTMIVSGSGPTALIKGELQLNNGLAFITNLFIDTHFTERGRFGRLIQTVASNPAVLGLGLGEDTGAVIYNGDELEIIGSSLAMITDAQTIKYTDLTDVADGEPITVEGVSVHVLGKGKIFSLKERRLLKS
jgi:cyanophycinase